MILRSLAASLAASIVVGAAFLACSSAENEPRPESTTTDPGQSTYPIDEATGTTSEAVGVCNGTPGQWAGCRGTGCYVCSETTQKYPYYFVNHPKCVKNLTCDGQLYTCNANCPKPTNADKAPKAGQCNGTAGQWDGCRGNGCAVCSEKLVDYPFYFTNHPNCVRNDTCAGEFYTCNASCPAPTEADKEPPAGTCNGSPGQWNGCRGNGCAVCAEKLVGYPKYFQNHPNCANNTTCAGEFFECNSNCPAPTAADR